MDIRQLRYFIEIAEARSLCAAARKIGVAQPSLSQHLINMEQELGVRLVDRSRRGSELTSEGKVLLRHAREICVSLDRCVDDIRGMGRVVQGAVRLGLPPSVSMMMSVPLAETVRVEAPNVRLQTSEAMSGFIKAWVDDETVDIGFLYDLVGVEHFNARHLLNEQISFFSAPDNWPLDTMPGSPVSMRALEGLELILPSEKHGLRRVVERAAASCGVKLNVVTELDAMTQIKELAARGSGHTLFAPAAAFDFVESGRLVQAPIVDPVISRPVYLVRNKARTPTRASDVVESLTLEVANDMIRRGLWKGTLVESSVGSSS